MRTRCAIHTRKSSEDGLEQEFNSFDAQREACAAFFASQEHEGWILLEDRYDDGGLSGGSLERPALLRLLEGIRDGHVDQIVVNKIDRLTCSLADSAKFVDILDEAEASFVSVTQSFNSATSMGRLKLNMLLFLAQFEREVTAERIRDKTFASKRKGLWMGGTVPPCYDPDGRTLKVNEAEARTIRAPFAYCETQGLIHRVKQAADDTELLTKRRVSPDGTPSGGRPFSRDQIYKILTNPIYAGRIRHKGQVHDGQHEAIIAPERWDKVQAALQDGATRSRRNGAMRKRKTQRSPLTGKLLDETGDRLTPSHSKSKAGARLR